VPACATGFGSARNRGHTSKGNSGHPTVGRNLADVEAHRRREGVVRRGPQPGAAGEVDAADQRHPATQEIATAPWEGDHRVVEPSAVPGVAGKSVGLDQLDLPALDPTQAASVTDPAAHDRVPT